MLHPLRAQHAARSDPARDATEMVSVPIARVQHALRAAMGHRVSSRVPRLHPRLDLPQPSLRRQLGLQPRVRARRRRRLALEAARRATARRKGQEVLASVSGMRRMSSHVLRACVAVSIPPNVTVFVCCGASASTATSRSFPDII